MRVLVKQEDFLTVSYELIVGKEALEFSGKASFSLPYALVRDFCITKDKRGKTYFTTICDGKMIEGQIVDGAEADSFAARLKAKLGGVIHIEIRKY